MTGPPPLSREELLWLCDFVRQRTGMQFGPSKRYYIERRLHERMLRTGASTAAMYFLVLRGDPDEVVALINSLTVNETYFYREEHQFRCLSDALLPDRVRDRRPGDKVRIWSAPCSTGEEAYSIAIWLLENWRMVDAYNVEIVGSDLDTDALAAARIGHYGARALARLPEALVERYFEPRRRGGRDIIADLKESVEFTRVNLLERASMTAHGRFDVIFCRNALIYFDDRSRAATAENLFACLAPGGFLCLGHSESMVRISDRFEMRRFPDAIVYQRPERG